jgi:uroporphyrinogen decarboxylase
MQTSRDLVLTALEGDTPERVPVSIVSSAWVLNHYGMNLSAAYENADMMTHAWTAFDRDFGADAVIPGLTSTAIPAYYGTTWKFPPVGFPLLQKAAIEDPSDLDSLEELDPLSDKAIRASIDHTRDLVGRFGSRRCIWFMATGPLSNASRLVHTEFLMESLIEDPPFVERLFQFSMDAFKAAIEPILDLGVDIIDFSSSPGSPDLISPRMYRQFFWGLDKELVNWIHKRGAKAVFHICGNTMPIMEDMVKTGADGLSLDAVVSLDEAREVVGKTALVGNIDPAGVLMKGSTEDVKKACIAAMRDGGIDGAFVLAPGCDVPPTSPQENIRIMVDTAKQHGSYPLSV